jgi:cephalosporin hydroxylase
MQLTIDTTREVLVREADGERREMPLYSPEAFALLSQQWLRVGWAQRYSYTFSWLGRPIIQLPEDIIRIQEVIHQVEPDVIIETGVAHGGTLVFYASLCKVLGRGRVVGIDIEIRDHNREAVEEHALAEYITLLEGSSTDPRIVERVKALVQPGEAVLVVLDSDHSRAHVLTELEAYADLVSVGSYIVATDGIMRDLVGVPGSGPDWEEDNPYSAAQEFSRQRPDFTLEQPHWPFNESNSLRDNVTYWPGAWLRRRE